MIELIEVNPGLPPTKISLRVKGRLLRASLGQRSVTQISRHYIVTELNSSDILGEAFLDTRLPEDVKMMEITCLFVLQAFDKERFVLILSGEEKKYERLGIGVIWGKSKSYEDPEIGSDVLGRAQEETVTLV